MSGEISTIQSLKAVDAWIDVINANINGGVRTAFKSSRLTFSGSNTDVDRPGNATSLPLQFPEPSLTTANTVIDFTQGAITASTSATDLALQGQGFFKVRPLNDTSVPPTVYYTRDGEFRWMAMPASATIPSIYAGMTLTPFAGCTVYLLVNKDGLALCCNHPPIFANDVSVVSIIVGSGGVLYGEPVGNAGTVDVSQLDQFMDDEYLPYVGVFDVQDHQSLQYTQYGSTVFKPGPATGPDRMLGSDETTVLNRSLEASNSSMTQSVPELSLAQKLFSALTKVLQTKQTDIDGVLNLVR